MMKRLTLLLALAALVGACGSSDKNRLLSRLEAAGDRCPTGGVVVASGNDDDGDGTLDDDEVDTTDLLCSNNTLTRVDAIAPGEICPNGGTSIKAGVDDDDDGVLADPEVDTTQNLCKGTLVRSTTLATTDAACYGLGGVRLELGIDDDSDDVLDVEEVDLTTITCNVIGSHDPPPGPEGAAQILLPGGNASGGRGGAGGSLLVNHDTARGGSLAAFRTGAVDASFTMPTRTVVPGAQPFTLAASANIPDAVPPATIGAPYTSGGRLYLSDGDGTAADEPIVTSLVIDAGVTATFNTASLSLSADLVNNGVIKRAGAARSMVIDCLGFVSGPDSAIDLRGDSDLTGAALGTAGGPFTLNAQQIILNQGDIRTTGGTGSTAGATGAITLQTSGGAIFNRGDLDASGGNSLAAASTGGAGGSIQLYGYGGRVANSGNLSFYGGTGTAMGGFGQNVYIYAQPGDILNSGTFDGHGGTTAGCTVGCRGGGGGVVDLQSSGGGIFSSGEQIVRGGAGSDTGCGGNAGRFSFSSYSYGLVGFNQGNIHLSGTLDGSGGPGGTGALAACATQGGGAGADLNLTSSPSLPHGQEVLFLGYAKMTTVGGSSGGAQNGGSGGEVRFNRSGNYGNAIGPVVNYVDIDTTGGAAGGTGQGGAAGPIYLGYGASAPDYVSGVGSNRVINRGKLTSDGGPGNSGGAPASFSATTVLYGPEGVDNSALISARGGTGTPNSGNNGGGIILSSDVGQTTNTGALTSSGGAGSSGGFAGALCLEGAYVSNSAAITGTGGNATTTTAGRGARLIFSSFNAPTANTGAVNVAAGTGGTGGLPGTISTDSTAQRCWPILAD